jgi:hypothetical protein
MLLRLCHCAAYILLPCVALCRRACVDSADAKEEAQREAAEEAQREAAELGDDMQVSDAPSRVVNAPDSSPLLATVTPVTLSAEGVPSSLAQDAASLSHGRSPPRRASVSADTSAPMQVDEEGESVISNVRGEDKEGTATTTTSIPPLPQLQPLPQLGRVPSLPSLQAEPQQEATTGHGADASETESVVEGRASIPSNTRVRAPSGAGERRSREHEDEDEDDDSKNNAENEAEEGQPGQAREKKTSRGKENDPSSRTPTKTKKRKSAGQQSACYISRVPS